MKAWFCLFIPFVLVLAVAAQPFERRVTGTDGKPVTSATVMLKPLKGNHAQIFAITDSAGKFRVSLMPLSVYRVVVRHLSFETDTFEVEALADGIRAPERIVLKPRHQPLQEVTVVRKAPVIIRQDTVIYRADAYAGPDTRKVEDLLSKMQGFSIGSDGRITYNGQVVERVMIEGDDLTGRSYQLLTRNLNAGYIDKVEVLLNDHENRLLKEQGNAGKVGINLSMKKNFLGKWNGGLDLLASVNKRYEADGHGILVQKKIKLFSFFNLNNVANNPLDQAEAFEQLEDGSSLFSGAIQREMVLRSGELFPPDLPDKYVRNNRDAGLATMLTWRTGKHTSMRLVAGWQKRHWGAKLASVVKTFPESLQSWEVSNEVWQQQDPQTVFLRWTAQTDRGKKTVSEYAVQLAYLQQRNRYANVTGIDISDSLTEQLHDIGIQMTAKWKATRKMGRNTVSITDAELWFKGIEQGLSNFSSRYAGYFNLKQGSYLQLQDLWINGWGFHVKQQWAVKTKAWMMQWGGMMISSRERLNGDANIMNVQEDTAFTTAQTLLMMAADLQWSLRYDGWKKMGASVDIRGGPRLLNWKGVRTFSAGVSMKAEWSYRFNLLQSLRMSWQCLQDLPGIQRFTPEPLISGNGLILRSIVYTSVEKRQLVQLGYFSNELKKQLSWSLRLQWRFGESLYVPDVLVTPAYSVDALRLAAGNGSFMLMGSVEKYVHQLRGKLGMSAAGNVSNRVNILNLALAMLRNETFYGEVWWAGLIGKKIRLETRLKISGTITLRNGQDAQTLWFPGWSQKLNWQWSDRGFLSCLWRASPFGSGSYAQGIDAHLQQKIGKRWTLIMQGHNLLHQQHLALKQISAYQSVSSAYLLVGRYVLVGGSLQL